MAEYWTTFRKAAQNLADRNPDPFIRRTKHLLNPDSDVKKLSGWVDVPSVDGLVQYAGVSSNGGKQFYRYVDDTTLIYNPPFRFRTITFDVLSMDDIESCTVRVKFDYEDRDRQVFKNTSFVNGEFNEQSVKPFRFSAPDPADRAVIELTNIDYTPVTRRLPIFDIEGSWTAKPPRAGLSVPRAWTSSTSRIPIFLISVDTFRHDHLDCLSATRAFLGDDAFVPSEPRTQGTCTWPSHASMFTSTHPGTHGSHSVTPAPPIHDSLTTLPEYLEQHGYTCSGLVASSALRPEAGFARGFHRYAEQAMNWRTRRFDAATNVETLADWVRADLETDRSQFYFLHLFDSHYPYYPPLPKNNLETLDYRVTSRFPNPSSNRNYVELLETDPLAIDSDDLDLFRGHYSMSLDYIDAQLCRLLAELRQLGLYDDALIVITGDHGEDFYEKNFIFHNSVYDTNIRPGMLVKPPADSDLQVPDTADTIDIFPTVAHLLDSPSPNQCEGQPWTDAYTSGLRITERLLHNYVIAVERDGVKAILTYDTNSPARPTDEQFAAGPLTEEYYALTGTPPNREQPRPDLDPDAKERLRNEAARFVRTHRTSFMYQSGTTTDEVKERLEQLGYRTT